ncbi:MAG: peptidylprolyl isomerase [Gammaproteobacteria bacterium]|nr:MAG: peptidylprolyl isomerase [Gammaproteobacteria bacterium]
MLQSIRERAQGWLAWVIIILISIPFALWGINRYFGGGGEVAIASVNGTDITLRQWQRTYQQQRQRLLAVLGGDVDDELLKQQILDGLIEHLLLLQAAQSMGLAISDVQLAAYIQAQPLFQKDGHFDRQRYEQVLSAQGMTPGMFEQQLYQRLLIQQMRLGITESALLTPSEAERMARLKGQRRTVSLLVVGAKPFLEGLEIQEDAIKRYYETHEDAFTLPEQVQVQYIELSVENLMGQVPPPDEATLKRLYEESKADFVVPEARRARHILIPIEGDEAKAKALAEELLQRLKKGEDFAALAKAYSKDPGSARLGGDLGYFSRGVMDKAFEEAVFSMKKGEIRLVRTPFGFHIVQVTDIRPPEVKPFEKVKEDLIQRYRRREAERMFLDKAEELANLVYEHPDTLEPAAEALELPIKVSDFFTPKGGEGIASNPKVVEAAFSRDVLEEGYNSEPIEIAPDHLLVLRVLEHRPPALQPLVEVHETIEKRLKQEKAAEKARALGEKILERLKSGEDPEAVARDQGLSWEPPMTLGREDTRVHPDLLKTAFRLPKPKDGPTYGGLSYPSGDYAVIRLEKVEEGSPEDLTDEEREALRRDLGEAAFAAFVKGLRQAADVKVYPDRF